MVIYRKSAEYVKKKTNHPLIIAEVGCFKGGNALALITLNVEKLYLIDPYKEYWQFKGKSSGYNQNDLNAAMVIMKKRMFGYKDKVTIIRKESVKASIFFIDEYFDYVYLDADHSYLPTLNDINAWYPKVKKGGFLAGHDYSTPETAKAVIDFCHKNKLRYINWCNTGEHNLPDTEKDWLIEKEK